MPLTDEERIEIVLIVGDGYKTIREACEIFAERHPGRTVHYSTVSRLVQRFKDTGSIKDSKRSGRPKSATGEDNQINTLAVFRRSPIKSQRKAADEVGISQRSLGRILKLHKFHPFICQLIHGLDEEDHAIRLDFCQLTLEKIELDILNPFRVCFGDEAIFSLNGHVNRHNCRYYAPLNENPHWHQEIHFQHDQRVMVWAGILGERVLGPFFFESTVTGNAYLDKLRSEIIPAIEQVQPRSEIWFMQDGAPAHFATTVRQFLDEQFPEQWIGRSGPVEWPARSPDMNPLDYFLWGHLKSVVYTNRPKTIENLKQNITAACQQISPETLTNVIDSWSSRMRHCIVAEGNQFEHLI